MLSSNDRGLITEGGTSVSIGASTHREDRRDLFRARYESKCIEQKSFKSIISHRFVISRISTISWIIVCLFLPVALSVYSIDILLSLSLPLLFSSLIAYSPGDDAPICGHSHPSTGKEAQSFGQSLQLSWSVKTNVHQQFDDQFINGLKERNGESARANAGLSLSTFKHLDLLYSPSVGAKVWGIAERDLDSVWCISPRYRLHPLTIDVVRATYMVSRVYQARKYRICL